MDDRLWELYERELAYLETHVADFKATERMREAQARLGLGKDEQVRDPFVEWLLQGTAFLAARVQYTIEAEFPRFTGALLDIVFPHLSAPTPSMLIAQFGFAGTPGAAALSGPMVPRGMALGMPVDHEGERTRRRGFPNCTYVTGRSVRLWPAKAAEARYLPNPAAVSDVTRMEGLGQAGVMLRLEMLGSGSFAETGPDFMDLHLSGDLAGPRLMAALAFGGARACVLVGAERRRGTTRGMPLGIEPLGFEREIVRDADPDGEGRSTEEDTLLPYDRRSFDGYRLLHEYFAMPERFRFIRLSGLRSALSEINAAEATVLFTFDGPRPNLEDQIGADSFRLNCVPAINLFPKTANNVEIDPRRAEHEMVADRDLPTAYEIHTVRSATGRRAKGGEVALKPFFATGALNARRAEVKRGEVYYVAARRPRPTGRTLDGDTEIFKEAGYRGADLFLSFAEAGVEGDGQGDVHQDLRAIRLETLCTNRFLPALRRRGDIELHLLEECGAGTARIVGRPSPPREAPSAGGRHWDIVSHLSLNHLSLVETERGVAPVEALRQLLDLYAGPDRRDIVDGLTGVSAEPVIGRLPVTRLADGRPVPVAVARGIEIALHFGPRVHEAPMLAAVLERFFAGYAPTGAFTRTVLKDNDNRTSLRWPNRTGLMKTL